MTQEEKAQKIPPLRMQAHWLIAQSVTHPKPSNKLAGSYTRTEDNKTRDGNKAVIRQPGKPQHIDPLVWPCYSRLT